MLMKKRMQLEDSIKTRFSEIVSCLVCVLITVLITVMLPVSEAIGIAALCVLFFLLICFVFWQPNKELRKILIIAFLLRATLALIHVFVVPLPDSQADAVRFERVGWELAQGWAAGAPFDFITGAYLYSWFIGIVYFVIDRSPLLIQALNVFLGTLIIYIAASVSRELFDSRTSTFVAWIACLFPTLLLYSALTMREMAVAFTFALGVLFFVRWLKKDQFHFLVKSMLCILVSGLFHTGMLFLLAVLLVFWCNRTLGAFLRLRMGSFTIKVLASLLIISVVAFPLVTGAGMEKFGDLSRLIDPKYLGDRHEIQARDRAAYLTNLNISSYADLIYAVPLKTMYFLFAPFPWNVKASIDAIGMADGLFYLCLVLSALYGFKEIRRQHGKFVFWGLAVLLLAGIVVFAMGTGNYGTALRHRTKFAFLLIVIAGPVVQKLWYLTFGRIRIRKTYTGSLQTNVERE